MRRPTARLRQTSPDSVGHASTGRPAMPKSEGPRGWTLSRRHRATQLGAARGPEGSVDAEGAEPSHCHRRDARSSRIRITSVGCGTGAVNRTRRRVVAGPKSSKGQSSKGRGLLDGRGRSNRAACVDKPVAADNPAASISPGHQRSAWRARSMQSSFANTTAPFEGLLTRVGDPDAGCSEFSITHSQRLAACGRETVSDQVGQHIHGESISKQRCRGAAPQPCIGKHFERAQTLCTEVRFPRR